VAVRPLPPMLASSARHLPKGAGWSYEVKFDGYRTLAIKDGSRVKLLSRNLKDATRLYPAVAREVARLRAESVLLDGEIVAVDEEGRPSFQALHHQAAHTVVYYAFDLLHLDGRDLISTPLDERRESLARVLKGSRLLRSEPLPGTPEQIEKAVRELHLEGVVAKRRNSRYEPGKRSRSWVKVKFNRRQEFVVGGFKPNANGFESLLVGYYDGRKLMFASKVRAGLTPHTRVDLFPMLMALVQPKCAFANLPSSKTGPWGEGITAEDMTALRWVKPKIVVEVSFVEWTRDGLLRHPEFIGVRTDRLSREVQRET
jgi:bifunctional non-homologous end joining protein LigD